MPRLSFSLPLSAVLGGFVLALDLLTCGLSAVHAQDAAPAPLAQNTSLRQLMTPEEFKASGLNKLSPDQLDHLERFLQGYREQTVQQVAKATEEKIDPAPKRDRATHQAVVENHIKGPFTGLTGRTRVLLDNGSIWQQANENDKFPCHLDSPDIVLVRTVFGYKMYVTGAPRWFYVRQVVL